MTEADLTREFLVQTQRELDRQIRENEKLREQVEKLEASVQLHLAPRFEMTFANRSVNDSGRRADVQGLRGSGPNKFVASPADDGIGLQFEGNTSIATTGVISLPRLYSIEFLLLIPKKSGGKILSVGSDVSVFINSENKIDFRSGRWNLGTDSRAPIAPNVWHHVVLQSVWDTSNQQTDARFWVDGRLYSSTRYSVLINSPITIGEGFIGSLDEIRIYDRVLTNAEVLTRANGYPKDPPSP